MKAQKEHHLNGFIYTHDRFNFDGKWVHFWSFRPEDKDIWCPYSQPDRNTKKDDVIIFLRDPVKADEYYRKWLDSASDVKSAEHRLEIAKARYVKVSDPEWGGRGNNPDKDQRTVKYAREELKMAERVLEDAKSLSERLKR
ncbi:MAG: hypothetical protein [Phage NG54]|nr:MAG: hypothetical protein [Phage NG54]